MSHHYAGEGATHWDKCGCGPLKFTIKGQPLIWQRPKAFYHKRLSKMWHYDPQEKERRALALALLEARTRASACVLTGDLILTMAFYYESHGRRKMDLSNMIKALEDSGNGVLWEDDQQIQVIHASKLSVPVEAARTEIEIEEIK